MSTANYDVADLTGALAGGLVREDVIEKIYNLDEGIPTPFTDIVARDSFEHLYSEWTRNDLNSVDLTNAAIDGSDPSGNDAKIGTRVGNRAQLSDKVVRISDLGESVRSIGGVGKMAYQTAKRLMDLRRDVEAIALSSQASVADTGSVAGKTAGFGAWLETNSSSGSGGSAGGFNTTTKIVDAPVAGAARGLTWTAVRDAVEDVYTLGGNPAVLMSTPGVIKAINTFLFSSNGAPYRATPTSNVGGQSPVAQAAQGYINAVITDFGTTLTLEDNRLQQVYASADSPEEDVQDVFLIDPSMVALAYMGGYEVKALATSGHNEQKLARVCWMTKVYREDAHAVIRDVDLTAVAAS